MRASILVLAAAVLLAPLQARAARPPGYRLAHGFALAGAITAYAGPALFLAGVLTAPDTGPPRGAGMGVFVLGLAGVATGIPMLAGSTLRGGTLLTHARRSVWRTPGLLAWIGFGATAIIMPVGAVLENVSPPIGSAVIGVALSSYFAGVACGIAQLVLDDTAARSLQEWADARPMRVQVQVTPVYTRRWAGAAVTLRL